MTQTSEESSMTIGELARRSGLAVSTIRAWEQRYGLLSPARSAGGHRRYSAEDLRRLRAAQALVEQGVSRSAAAGQAMEGGSGAAPAGHTLPVPAVDPIALRAAYQATRSLLALRRPKEAVDILVSLVRELGGDVVPAEHAGPDALPLDLSLGECPPLLPVADPYSVTRLHLERVLPTVVDDARRAAAIARRLSSVRGRKPAG